MLPLMTVRLHLVNKIHYMKEGSIVLSAGQKILNGFDMNSCQQQTRILGKSCLGVWQVSANTYAPCNTVPKHEKQKTKREKFNLSICSSQ